MDDRKKWGPKKIIFVFILVIAGINIINWVFFKPAAPKTPEQERKGKISFDRKMSAWTISKQFVSEQLKAPSTAKFQDYEEKNVLWWRDNTYLVSMAVDAQNSFGTMIRSKFACEIEWLGEHNWRLINIGTPEQVIGQKMKEVKVDEKPESSIENGRKPGQVFSTDFGDRWPLTVAKGAVCLNGQTCIFASRDEVTKKVAMYHLSGPVIRSINIGDIKTIMKPGKTIADLSELIEIAKKNPVPEK